MFRAKRRSESAPPGGRPAAKTEPGVATGRDGGTVPVGQGSKINHEDQVAQWGGRRPGAGRKKGKVSAAKRALSEMARDHAEEALKTLVDIAKDAAQPAAARVSAATGILDRAYGKPPQSMEHSGPDGGPLPAVPVIIISATDDPAHEGAG